MKLDCICGQTIYDSELSCAIAFRNNDWDDDKLTYIHGRGRWLCECKHCGAIAFDEPKGSLSVVFYKPVNNKFNKLFRDDTTEA